MPSSFGWIVRDDRLILPSSFSLRVPGAAHGLGGGCMVRLNSWKFMPLEMPPMSNTPFEPWPLDERTAKVLGLPLVALTPTARLVANGAEWLWFDPAAAVAIWQGPVWQHGFPADSLDEALARVERRAVG